MSPGAVQHDEPPTASDPIPRKFPCLGKLQFLAWYTALPPADLTNRPRGPSGVGLAPYRLADDYYVVVRGLELIESRHAVPAELKSTYNFPQYAT